MRGEPVIAEGARKHGDVLHAYANPVQVFDLDEGFTQVIGANPAAILLQVGVVEGAAAPGVVHAMRSRHRSKVMIMPRTVQDILDHGDELAKLFWEYDPAPDDERDPEILLLTLRRAVLGRSEAERSVQKAVNEARAHGYSWRSIGALLVRRLTSVALAVEIGGRHRLTGNTLGSFVGLVPTESSSGVSRVQG